VCSANSTAPKQKQSAALKQQNPHSEGADIEIGDEKIHIPAYLFEVRDEVIDTRGEDIVPHVIEPSYGIDRMCYALLEQAYDEDTAEGEKRTVMRFSPKVAPVQVAVFPLMTRDNLDIIAEEITSTFHKNGILAEYDGSGAIGRRYRRQDEIGTPYAITVDYDTKENNSVTLRDRDTMEQVRLPIGELTGTVRALVEGRITFASLKP
jgi:glycyl-tRNA synthetase